MYNNYTREELIQKIEQQQHLLNLKSEVFHNEAPVILYPDEINNAERFIKIMQDTLSIAKLESKTIDIQSYFDKKERYYISDDYFLFSLLLSENIQAITYAQNMFSSYIKNANIFDSVEHYSILFSKICELLSFSKNHYFFNKNANIIHFIIENVNKLKNYKEKDFIVNYIREIIVSDENLHHFININKKYNDILNLKEHPESLHSFSLHRHSINKIMKENNNNQDVVMVELIDLVIETGVFDDEIKKGNDHYINIFQKKLSMFDTDNKKQTLFTDKIKIREKLLMPNTVY